MKRIICELCDCNEFVKAEGMFVCQGCGTKYTLEEAKSLMHDVEGDSVISTPPRDKQEQSLKETGAAPDDKNEFTENFMVIATTEFESGNMREAENYCNKVIQANSSMEKAWLLKGKCIALQSTLEELRIVEASHIFTKAIEFSSQKDSTVEEALSTLREATLTLVKKKADEYYISPNEKDLAFFDICVENFKESIKIVDASPSFLDKLYNDVADIMNNVAYRLYQTYSREWEALQRPSDNDLGRVIFMSDAACRLYRTALKYLNPKSGLYIDLCNNLVLSLEYPIGKSSYGVNWNSMTGQYENVVSRRFPEDSVKIRQAEILDIKSAVNRITEEIKQQRIEEYWAEHPEEKETLFTQKEQLLQKKNEIYNEISVLEVTLSKEKIDFGDLEKEEESLHEELRQLNMYKDSAFISKKKIEEIDEAVQEIEEEIAQIEEQKSDITLRFNQRVADIKRKIEQLKYDLYKISLELKTVEENIQAPVFNKE